MKAPRGMDPGHGQGGRETAVREASWTLRATHETTGGPASPARGQEWAPLLPHAGRPSRDGDPGMHAAAHLSARCRGCIRAAKRDTDRIGKGGKKKKAPEEKGRGMERETSCGPASNTGEQRRRHA